MNYYFPSLITAKEMESTDVFRDMSFTVNSGENAIRLLLRSYGLSPGSVVALPVYVCDSLKQAVLSEGMQPLYLDLKPDGSFWTDYNTSGIQKSNTRVVILVHLYGFIHPDTQALMNFCKSNSIFLIHDAAQSYGIDEKKLSYSSGLVYSFGPGKSATAAMGATAQGLKESFYREHVRVKSNFSLQTIRAGIFLKSRMYGYHLSFTDKLMAKLSSVLPEDKGISSMSPYQVKAATLALKFVEERKEIRQRNYAILASSIQEKSKLRIAYDDGEGLYFKLVLRVEGDVAAFREYLHQHQVPFFSLMDSLKLGRSTFNAFPCFQETAPRLIELSAEASIPVTELKRVAEIIQNWE
ncbi:MAG TPA: DegT/DnrJ/EryC1/StrS family aminotransferase [Bacteroidia bacterium]|jgi:dTDP-4-amino-4,6-dideoxygalactose transaminase|nr:DegT/DnrJ/EryC1/StrS family aminotransferase [Bacteroidia bacterium]